MAIHQVTGAVLTLQQYPIQDIVRTGRIGNKESANDSVPVIVKRRYVIRLVGGIYLQQASPVIGHIFRRLSEVFLSACQESNRGQRLHRNPQLRLRQLWKEQKNRSVHLEAATV